MLTEHEIESVLNVFKSNYVLVPLEVFGSDPYKTLISTLMSSRTRDETTLNASERLFQKAPTIRFLHALDVKSIENLIYPVGFYKTKAKHLKQLADAVISKHQGQIPQTRTALMTLPGVGRKTANLVLNRAFDKPAIAVDTHVHRITNLLGWVSTKSPEETERSLNELIPEKYWSEINRLFVSIGRQYTTNNRLREFLQENSLMPRSSQV